MQDIAERLDKLLGAPKLLSGSIAWVGERRITMTRLSLRASLDIDGVTYAGLSLRATAVAELPQDDVMIQLEYRATRGRTVPMTRIDWGPSQHHTNRDGPKALRFLTISGSHVHRLADNLPLGIDTMISQNLPLARPLAAVAGNFSQLLTFVAQELNIINASELPAPPWSTEFRLEP